MARKKVLWLCSWYPGKIDQFTGDFIQRHARAAALYHDISVIHVAAVPRESLISNMEEESGSDGNLDERIIYFKSSRSLPGRIAANYKLIRMYRKAVKEYIRKNGKPAVLHIHIPMKAGIAGLWVKKRFNLPLLVSEHWGIYNRVVEDSFYNRGRFFRTLTKKIIRKAEVFISVSHFLIHEISKIVSLKKSRVIPNTVNTEQFTYRERPANSFRFLHVSNMVPLKNTAGLLRAFKELLSDNQAELVMVGNMDDRYKKYAAELGLSARVQFRGEISYKEVAREMQQANCLVLFSDIENSPCVIGEALCCGLPVIATTVGGIPELVNETNAILVSPRNEEELRAAMQKMMNKYVRFDRPSIARSASAKFSYEAIGKQFADLYNTYDQTAD